MRTLFAFDVEGTLERSGGPVKLERLRELASKPDCFVVIVSSSPTRPDEFLQINDADRLTNLKRAREACGTELNIYVSDNGDFVLAREAGFIYVDPHLFV